ncbi:PREDICTED: mitogen-activated protein kinase kinase kinase YODA isoform X1 [Ipomoea nil]|uniref:mitogen-activated protein kinase kinase kinase YODA isoform X1 n=1 Tax=Ipomoea nil TaxID=35883 RepID=UPI000901336F|nr:PREDICTED: mitogen-activated protein kinase kinase kinase YODA isoform X1 [Ipomoea nil]
MPAWWGRKSTKSSSKDPQPNSPASVKNESRRAAAAVDRSDRPKSFDESFGTVIARNSPRSSREFSSGRGSSGFSGFDSASSDKPLPLPTPSNEHGIGLGSGSESGSSVSSTGSYDDHPHPDHAQPSSFRGAGDNRMSPLSRSPVRSRAPTTTPSPLHPRFVGGSLDSPTGKLDDAKSECHRLPLPPSSPTSPPALPNPRTCVTESLSGNLSKWKRGKLLGRGTFGHVYLGFNSENGQMCAIKEVKVVADDQTSRECLKQLNQEISLLSQFSHPNIVQYYGSELGDETLSVYLEFVSGGSIHKLLQEYGPFKEPVIQNYARQILSGLAYLHARNTVHRDIKGANILVGPNGEIKVADFGMAKHINSASSMLSFKGSPYWMAPEVVMNTNGYSLAVDIWSLGCTILEMATSKPPWSQYEGVAAIFKIGNSKDMPEIPDHLSNDAKNFIRLCLQRDPSARPTAAQLLEHPFTKDQKTAKVAHANIIIKEPNPSSFDGSRTPPALDLHPCRGYMGSLEADNSTKPVTISRPMISSRESARTITSLPVSPCSSPLRQYEPARRSCYLSPQHPSYPLMGQSGYNVNDYSTLTTARPNTRSTLDPWLEMAQYRGQTAGRSSKTRPIL